jgi:hypothetical protein
MSSFKHKKRRQFVRCVEGLLRAILGGVDRKKRRRKKREKKERNPIKVIVRK